MLSFWEKQSFVAYDYVIVGGGIVGLSTAISLQEKAPKARVLVLERGLLPSGASTKNAGFACFGSATELISDINTMGEEAALELVKLRWEGLQLLERRLGKERMGFERLGGYELIRLPELYALNFIDKLNDWLEPIFEQKVFLERPELISLFGFNKKEVRHIIGNPFEGQIHTGETLKNLYRMATAMGVEVITGAEVHSFQEEENKVKIWVRNPVNRSEEFAYEAQQLIVCTNAFTKKLLPQLPLKPGRGMVLVTKPMAEVPFKGTFHYDEGFFYFRNVGNRVLFGGGRNLAMEEETTTEFGINARIFDRLKKDLKEVIFPNQPTEIEMAWSGIMAFGVDKQPIVQRVSPRMLVGVRMGGMGVAIGSKVGETLALQVLA
ncbi:FAD-dependent oxidoreductase [Cytophagales bacterium LB-30]|uniref:FAD-dependent oxidoreductase n=1 Tax=Shiella aurantiaca TaxID=3058365 RepID=A0ABT8F8W0_9BACT|nr:FAD-dependent oxidoreductase [Shiella aurantiaca]MDN4166918.1 FAD-dependent oxidoreductase [Shiella aurantiaca]